MYNAKRQGIIEADALDAAIGVVFSQEDKKGKLRPVVFFLRKLIPVELNYEIYNKELLAIVVAIKEQRYYIEGTKKITIIYIDY